MGRPRPFASFVGGWYVTSQLGSNLTPEHRTCPSSEHRVVARNPRSAVTAGFSSRYFASQVPIVPSVPRVLGCTNTNIYVWVLQLLASVYLLLQSRERPPICRMQGKELHRS